MTPPSKSQTPTPKSQTPTPPAPTDSGATGGTIGLYLLVALVVLGILAVGVSFARM